jgi:O-antigen/teichoic acid export membrane protein
MTNSEAVLADARVPKSLKKRVASNFGWAVTSEGIGRVTFFVANIYLARVLGVTSFGQFVLAQTLTLNFWIAVDLGVSLYGIREIAKDKDHSSDLINALFSMRLVGGLTVFIIYAVVVCAIHTQSPQQREVFLACGLYLPAYSLYTDWVAKGLEQFWYLPVGNLVSAAVFIAGLVAFVHNSADAARGGIVWSFAFLCGSLALGYVVNKKTGHKLRLVLDVRIWMYHLRESLFFSISGGLNALYLYLPIFLVGFFCSAYELGMFSAPYRVILTLGTAGFLLPGAFYPILSDLYVRDRRKFLFTFRWFQAIMVSLGLVAGIGGALFKQQIIHLLLGNAYSQSTGVFSLAIWMLPLWFTRYTYGSVLLATGHQRLQNLAGLTGVLVMLILGTVAVRTHGYTGVCIALLISESVLLLTLRGLSRFAFLRTSATNFAN